MRLFVRGQQMVLNPFELILYRVGFGSFVFPLDEYAPSYPCCSSMNKVVADSRFYHRQRQSFSTASKPPFVMPNSDSLYLIKDIPGKGRGLVAAASIPKGTRILSESPLIEVPRDVSSKERLRLSIASKLAALAED